MIFLLVILAIALGIFYYIVTLDIAGYLKFFLAAGEMLAVGQFLISRYKLSGEYGLILLKSQKGLELINRIAKKEELWKFLSDSGAVLSYGFLSILLMRKNISLKTFISGMVLLSAIFFFVAPSVLPFLAGTIGINTVEKGVVQSSTLSIVASVSVLLLYAGGLFLILLLSILAYGAFILSALLSTLLHGTQAIAKAAPGGTFLLPGINLPFFEGIAALIVILIVHEGAHAILARIAKIPVLSSGIVLFGFLPVGAFVEPDEEKLKKLDRTKQTRVLVAGSTANLLTSLVFFIIFLGFFYGTSQYREDGLLVLSGMEKNTVIHAVDGKPVSAGNYRDLQLPKNGEVTLLTNKGEIVRKTNEDGKIGITLAPITKDSINSVYDFWPLQFIYIFLGLCFSLNFVIGSVNLLPLPFFDGYRTLEINIENKYVVKGVMALTFIAFLINFLPWFFK